MSTKIAAAALSFAMLLGSLPASAQSYRLPQPSQTDWYAQSASASAMAPRRHRKVYYGVGFGGHHRTTATGGNAGGYSSRN